MQTRSKRNVLAGRFLDRLPATRIAMVAAATLAGARYAGAAAITQYWDLNGSTTGLGGAAGGTWDLATSNWSTDSTGASATSVWINADDAVFAGTAGTVTVDNLNDVTTHSLTFNVTGYTVTGGQLTLTGTTPTIKGAASTTTTVNAPIAGVSTGLTISGGGSTSTLFTIGSNNSYTGTTVISTAGVTFSSLAADGTNSSFGSSGTVQLANGSSASAVTYNGTGGSTNRLWLAGGTGAAIINANGTGAMSFTNTGAAVGGAAAGARAITLAGTSATSITNTFGEAISNLTGFATTLQKSGANIWQLTASGGMNTYSGGTSILAGTLAISQGDNLGTGLVSFTGSSTLSAAIPAVAGGTSLTLNNNISVGSGFTGSIATTTTNSNGSVFDIAGLVSGAGTLKLNTGSFAKDAVELSNDSNSFTNFSAGAGVSMYTSVANGGSVSSLGSGSGTYVVLNGNSAANLVYVGTNSTSTNRAIDWQGLTGKLTLDGSGTGSVKFLATGNLKSGSGIANLTLQGTNTGANTLAQVINDSAGGATSVTKIGAGNWTLTGANTYSGVTTISQGTLTVDGSIGASSAVSVAGLVGSAGVLAGTGTVAGPITVSGPVTNSDGSVNAAGTISPGDGGVGTLIASGGTTLSPGSALSFDLNTPNAAGGTGGNDLLATTALSLGTGITLTVAPGALFNTGTYDLIDYTGALSDNSASFSGWTVNGLPAGDTATFQYGTDGSANAVQLVVGLAAVPEPASLSILGLAGLTLVRRRRA